MKTSLSDKLAIFGGSPVRKDPFPPSPALGEEEIQAAEAVLRSGKFCRLAGEQVDAFEREYAQKFGVKYAVAVNSGTAAVHAALYALGIGPGDEVINTSHCFIGTATPVIHAGAVSVFADIDVRTFNLDPASVETKITPRTKAIIPVHLNGLPAEMDFILEIARKHNLYVIEDAAQAHGASYKGRLAGTMGIINCFSFWDDKILCTGGEGGMVVTDDPVLARTVKMFQNHGETPEEGTYYVGERLYFHEFLGYNYRMSEVQGAVGRVQLKHLDEFVAARRKNAHTLSDLLSQIEGVIPPYEPPESKHAFYKYIVRLDRNVLDVSAKDFVAALSAEGIPCSRRYPTPLHMQPVFVEKRGFGRTSAPFTPPWAKADVVYGSGTLPNAEQLPNDLFRLLMNPRLTDRELEDSATAIRKVVDYYKN
jgi:dTDP-4-amino-4,6-dideoxygalactose transaminase